MPKVFLQISNHTLNQIRSHTPLIKHFIRKAIKEKLKSYTHGVKNFDELSQDKNYKPKYTGNGILLQGKDILASKGHALIQGNTKQLELDTKQPISTVDSKATYKVTGMDTQLDKAIITKVSKQ